MNKAQFEGALRAALRGLPQEDIDRWVEYYLEMIEDRIEDGATEEQAVAAMGTTEELVAKTLGDMSLPVLVKNKLKPRRVLGAWEIVLLVLGFPVWGSVLIALLSALFAVYVVLWLLVVAVAAVFAAVAGSAVGLLVMGAVSFGVHTPVHGALYIGAALILAALAIFLFLAVRGAVKGAVFCTKRIVLWIKSMLVRKDVAE